MENGDSRSYLRINESEEDRIRREKDNSDKIEIGWRSGQIANGHEKIPIRYSLQKW